jgi:hypothetical protein
MSIVDIPSEGSTMGDHFWPALYPGLIVGLLYGLSLRGLANAVAGALGGLVGSALAYWALLTFGITEGLVSVAGMVVLAVLGAFGATHLYARMVGTTSERK